MSWDRLTQDMFRERLPSDTPGNCVPHSSKSCMRGPERSEWATNHFRALPEPTLAQSCHQKLQHNLIWETEMLISKISVHQSLLQLLCQNTRRGNLGEEGNFGSQSKCTVYSHREALVSGASGFRKAEGGATGGREQSAWSALTMPARIPALGPRPPRVGAAFSLHLAYAGNAVTDIPKAGLPDDSRSCKLAILAMTVVLWLSIPNLNANRQEELLGTPC